MSANLSTTAVLGSSADQLKPVPIKMFDIALGSYKDTTKEDLRLKQWRVMAEVGWTFYCQFARNFMKEITSRFDAKLYVEVQIHTINNILAMRNDYKSEFHRFVLKHASEGLLFSSPPHQRTFKTFQEFLNNLPEAFHTASDRKRNEQVLFQILEGYINRHDSPLKIGRYVDQHLASRYGIVRTFPKKGQPDDFLQSVRTKMPKASFGSGDNKCRLEFHLEEVVAAFGREIREKLQVTLGIWCVSRVRQSSKPTKRIDSVIPQSNEGMYHYSTGAYHWITYIDPTLESEEDLKACEVISDPNLLPAGDKDELLALLTGAQGSLSTINAKNGNNKYSLTLTIQKKLGESTKKFSSVPEKRILAGLNNQQAKRQRADLVLPGTVLQPLSGNRSSWLYPNLQEVQVVGTQKPIRNAMSKRGGRRASKALSSRGVVCSSKAKKSAATPKPPVMASMVEPTEETVLVCQPTSYMNIHSKFVKEYFKTPAKYGWMESKKCLGQMCRNKNTTISRWPTDVDGNQAQYCRDCFFQKQSNHIYCISCYQAEVLTNITRTRRRRTKGIVDASLIVQDVADV